MSQNDLELKERIILFIFKETSVKVDDRTVLFEDLHLAGLDADLFLLRFWEEFNLDPNYPEFDHYKRFFDPVLCIFYVWYIKLFNRKRYDRYKRILINIPRFNIDHLVEVVKKGYWIDPE